MHIQFKGLLMGWYHVNRIGKGICLGNVDEVHYNEDFIAKHTPTIHMQRMLAECACGYLSGCCKLIAKKVN